MRIAGHTLGTPQHSVPEALKLFARAGLDAAEVIYQDGYTSGLAIGDAAAAAEAAKAADGEGIPIIGLTPYTTAINSVDDTIRRGAVDELRSAIDTAHFLGATRIRVYAGSWQPDAEEHERHWAQLVRSFRELAVPATDAGVLLCAENHFGTMTQSARDTAALVREVDSPAVRVLYDQANLTFAHDEDPEQAFAVQGDLIGHVHVKDLVFVDPDAPFVSSETARVHAEERSVRSRVVGDGTVPWDRIVEHLRGVGYDDTLSLEYEYRWHPQDLDAPEIGFRRGAEHLRALLAQSDSTNRTSGAAL
ncbi:sugar phosphate isomerase/epimerase family protein [Rhodococcus erythropolis]|uniref:sugar phosphate isomerase/epimerase family protein n=1 Tax=Rhodococcus erythropolis TaxID=1833 RepID=UPI00294A20C1|nr:sugar phosphate isomerase/epimerase family protein [Rhodococcus erythropolis]MDV6212650.1 sugar phosphate isomerase/epimerase family protein [Rhodococcus erythropolis]